MSHEHWATPEMQAVALAVARAVLARDHDGAVAAAQSAECPECLAVACLQLGFSLVVTFTGQAYGSADLARDLAQALEYAQRELDKATGSDAGLS